MRNRLILLFVMSIWFYILICSCVSKKHENANSKDIALSETISDSLRFRKVQKDLLIGHFCDKEKQDTIFQSFYSKKMGKRVG